MRERQESIIIIPIKGADPGERGIFLSSQYYTIRQEDTSSLPQSQAKLLSISWAQYSEEWNSSLHTHNHAELFFVIGGQGSFQLQDRQFSVSNRDLVVINAGGIWGHGIAAKAGITINMLPAKGALLIFGHRVNNLVLNRCRKPADADILVPGDTISLIGTTSSKVPFEEVDNMVITPDEVDLLLREGEKLAPQLAQTRILRAYAGVRPLVASDDDPSGRTVSRGIVLLDHATRDGLEGFITITGGKLMTYRLMAEWATDLVCRKIGVNQTCRTPRLDQEQPGLRMRGGLDRGSRIRPREPRGQQPRRPAPPHARRDGYLSGRAVRLPRRRTDGPPGSRVRPQGQGRPGLLPQRTLEGNGPHRLGRHAARKRIYDMGL